MKTAKQIYHFLLALVEKGIEKDGIIETMKVSVRKDALPKHTVKDWYEICCGFKLENTAYTKGTEVTFHFSDGRKINFTF